jgi:5-methylcytosine-specific restriction endonuclease McrA
MGTISQARAERRKERQGQDRPSGKWIRSDLRFAIYLRDGFRCAYCGADLHGAAPQDITLDHVYPWSLGGENDATNLVTACRSCNCSRGAKKLHEYADQHTRKTVRRQTARKIDRYRKLAKSILSGECPEESL